MLRKSTIDTIQKIGQKQYRHNPRNRKIPFFLSGLMGLFLAPTLWSINEIAYSQQNLPYEPETCKSGYVWREAVPNDYVCVTPESREQAVLDNTLRESRISSTDRTYGLNTCIAGYVWREAVPSDLVCVTPEIRTQAQLENAQAENNHVISSPTESAAPNVSNERLTERVSSNTSYHLPNVSNERLTERVSSNASYLYTIPDEPPPPQFLGTSETLSNEAATLNALNIALEELRRQDDIYDRVGLDDLSYEIVSAGEGVQGGPLVRWVIIRLIENTAYFPGDCPQPPEPQPGGERIGRVCQPLQLSLYVRDPRKFRR